MKKRIVLGILILVIYSLVCVSCERPTTKSTFVEAKNGLLYKEGKPYYYIGANFWYGAILSSTGQGGNRNRLNAELDSLFSLGIDNLRILVGADGKEYRKSKVYPVLQLEPGVYNDTILDGLDYLIDQMSKRQMKAVLFLNNSWEWTGGYGQYLEWAGYGRMPIPALDGWNNFRKYVSQFITSASAQKLFDDHVKFILNRTNRYSGIRYVDDPTIMAWQIGNEPRAFSDENKKQFADWLAHVSSLIKSIDKNHLLSVGSEGERGCEDDLFLWKYIHEDKNIDYATFHIWPKNWKWIDTENIPETIEKAIDNTIDYISSHVEIAEQLKKPLVLEEFGFPRDSMGLSPQTSTNFRDIYYKYVCRQIVNASQEKLKLVGCNFWSWAGLGKAIHEEWKLGDDYLGDPAQEPQGLNSVFITDSTVNIIKVYQNILRTMNNNCKN